MGGKSLLFALAVSALSAASAAAAPAKCNLAKVFELPVAMVGPRAQITVKINGTDATFFVDSGAFFGFMTPEAVDRLKLSTSMAPPGFAVRGVGGTDHNIYVATVRDFGFGGTNIHNVQFIVAHGLDADTSGLIGQNVLAAFDAEYDFGNGVIRLMKPDSGCAHSNLAYWAGDRAVGVMDISRIEPLMPQIRGVARVNGQEIKVVLDTGSPRSMLKRSAAERLGFRPDAPDVRATGPIHGAGRHVAEGWIAPFDSFEIGGEQIKHVQLRVADIVLDNADMLLGADFFLSHRVYVAELQHKLYFTYNGGRVFQLDEQPAPAQAAAPAATAASAAPAEKYADTPTDAAGFARRGEAFMSRRSFAAALADFNRAVELEPANPRYVRDRAMVRFGLGQPVLAMADLDEALKLKPDDAQSHLARGELYLASKETARAQADFDAALKADPDLALQVASLFSQAGQFERAVAGYDAFIAAHPKDDRLTSALNGRCWARALWNHELDLALADCEAAMRRGPHIAAFYDSRGLVHLRRGEYDLAIADYDQAIKLQPKQAWSLYGRGLARQAKGQAAEGQADLQAANAIAPQLATAIKRYGLDGPARAAGTP